MKRIKRSNPSAVIACMLGALWATTAGATGGPVEPNAWDEMVEREPLDVLEAFSQAERRALNAMSPEEANRLVDGLGTAGLVRGDDRQRLPASLSWRFVPLDPCRIADTRRANGAFFDGEIRTFVVRGEGTDYSPQGGTALGCGIPGLTEGGVSLSNVARAVLVNLKVIDPTGVGGLKAWSSSDPQPLPIADDYRNLERPLRFNKLMVVPMCDEAGIDPCLFGDIKAKLTRSAHLAIDVYGYFLPAIDDLVVGSGLVGGGAAGVVELGVDFAGSGVAPTVAHSDHTHSELVPTGAIVMWSGALDAIPDGWTLCDGSDGTPDLRDRFVLGAGVGEEPGSSGGAHSITLTEEQLASHTHPITIASAGQHSHTFARPASVFHPLLGLAFAIADVIWSPHATDHPQTSASGAHVHAASAGSIGNSAPIDNRPAFFELAFIMKL